MGVEVEAPNFVGTPEQMRAALMARVLVDEHGCWLWRRAIDRNGYGRCNRRNARLREQWAHRLAYRLFKGPIPDGLDLDHLCRVRHCVNPDHLEPVTRSVNLKRSPLQGRAHAKKTHCLRGHPRTPENLYREPGLRGCRRCRICANASSQAHRRRKKERLAHVADPALACAAAL